MIYLTAPLDVQETQVYESALSLLKERCGPEIFHADQLISGGWDWWGAELARELAANNEPENGRVRS